MTWYYSSISQGEVAGVLGRGRQDRAKLPCIHRPNIQLIQLLIPDLLLDSI